MSVCKSLTVASLILTHSLGSALPVDPQPSRSLSRPSIDMTFVDQTETGDFVNWLSQYLDVRAQDDAAVIEDENNTAITPINEGDIVTVIVDKSFGQGTKQNLTVTYQNRVVFSTNVSTGGGIHQPTNKENPNVEKNNPPECTETPSMNISFPITKDRFFERYDSNYYGVPLKWAFRIRAGILFHQVPTAGSESFIGRPASGGCVRIPAANAKNFYQTLQGYIGKTIRIVIKGGDSSQVTRCLNSPAYKKKLAAWGAKYKRTPDQIANIHSQSIQAAMR